MTSEPATDKTSLRSAIIRKIERLANEAGAKAIAGDAPIANVEQIKALQSVLAALPQKPILSLNLAAGIGITCLLSVSIAVALPIPWSTWVQLNLTATSISMRLKNDFSWHGTWRVEPKQVSLRNFSRLELPPEYGSRRHSTLELNVNPKGNVRVSDLFFGHGARLAITTQESGTAGIVVRGAPFRGNIDISGEVNGHAGLTLDETLPQQQFDPDMPPGRFGFSHTGQDAPGQQPPHIHGAPIEALVFPDFMITDLSFVEEQPKPERPHETIFASQIIAGTLTMTDTGEQISLTSGAALRLADTRGRVAALLLRHKEVEVVKFEGTASDVTLGTGDFSRNLKPTILEWLFHQQKLGFFWGALTFLWGIAWSAHRLFSGVV